MHILGSPFLASSKASCPCFLHTSQFLVGSVQPAEGLGWGGPASCRLWHQDLGGGHTGCPLVLEATANAASLQLWPMVLSNILRPSLLWSGAPVGQQDCMPCTSIPNGPETALMGAPGYSTLRTQATTFNNHALCQLNNTSSSLAFISM